MKSLAIVFILFLLICLESCKNNGNFGTVCNAVSINNTVDSLLQVFIKENEKVDCQYFLVVYSSCDQEIVTLIANNIGDKYYLRNKALVYFMKNDKMIYLITGTEDVFTKKTEESINKKRKVLNPFENIKSYVISNNKIEFIPKGIPPFAPPPSKIDL
jgi:hypothetical protein